MPHIVSIGTSVPEFVVTNDYIVSLVIEHSRRLYSDDLSQLELGVYEFLEKAGANQRRWRAGFTKPLEHLSDAWANCLSNLGTESVKRIGALIYCGIDKGVYEPSHASLFAQKFSLPNVRTLDIADACMGWFTATQVGSKFVAVDRPLCAIVSAEFPIEVPGKVYPEAFKIRNNEDLLWKAAGFTLGECASVTMIDAMAPETEQYVFKS